MQAGRCCPHPLLAIPSLAQPTPRRAGGALHRRWWKHLRCIGISRGHEAWRCSWPHLVLFIQPKSLSGLWNSSHLLEGQPARRCLILSGAAPPRASAKGLRISCKDLRGIKSRRSKLREETGEEDIYQIWGGVGFGRSGTSSPYIYMSSPSSSYIYTASPPSLPFWAQAWGGIKRSFLPTLRFPAAGRLGTAGGDWHGLVER